MAVYVNGDKVEEQQALTRAAEILGQATLPVIGGLLADISGAQHAIALAEKLGGVFDHAAGEALTRAAKLMRETGATPASLGELRNRADRVVLLGDGPLKADPELLEKIFPEGETLPRPGDSPRELIVIGPKPANVPAGVKLTHIDLGNRALASVIGMLAAAVREKPFGDQNMEPGKSLASAAESLREAAFAVFVYAPIELDEPVLHVVLDTARALCDKTRAGTYTPPAPGNGDGVNLCSVWTCGLPVRTGFLHGDPEHDPWRFSADRLISSGEGDALLWIDAMAGSDAKPPKGAPTVLLSRSKAAANAADVVIEVAIPGENHDAALYLPGISGIGMVKGKTEAGGLKSVADIVAAISDQVAAREAGAC